MTNKEIKSKVKENNKELKRVKPFTFIHISLKLFFIESFNKLAQANNKRKVKKAIKKANKHQMESL